MTAPSFRRSSAAYSWGRSRISVLEGRGVDPGLELDEGHGPEDPGPPALEELLPLDLGPGRHDDVVLELRVGRRIGDDARDLAIPVVDADRLAEGVFGAEVLAGRPRREKHGVLAREGVAGVAPQQRDAEDPEAGPD